MDGEVSLPITVEIQSVQHDSICDRVFEDPGHDDPPLPSDFSWKAHIDRYHSHRSPPLAFWTPSLTFAGGRKIPNRGGHV